MVDIDLLVATLRRKGHTVESVIPVPENAGEFGFGIDGQVLTLSEARNLLERDFGDPLTDPNAPIGSAETNTPVEP